jgi:hypothetical protein
MAKQQAANRIALSVREFAELFGHHMAWGYRRIYEGWVKVIDDGGRILVPYSEVQRVLDSAKRYDPQSSQTKCSRSPDASAEQVRSEKKKELVPA